MMCEAMEREIRAEQLGDVKIGGAVARQIGARRERSERDETGLVYLCARGHTEEGLRPGYVGLG